MRRPDLRDPVPAGEEVDDVGQSVYESSSSQKPYRVGQSLAAPPSRAAQVFSSFLKN